MTFSAETISDYNTQTADFNMKMIFKFIFSFLFSSLFPFPGSFLSSLLPA